MGHRVGKALFIGCTRQSAVRSSISKGRTVTANGQYSTVQNLLSRKESGSQILKKMSCQLSTRKSTVHVKARTAIYPRTTDLKRSLVPDDQVPWSKDCIDYEPTDFTSATVLKGPDWADPVDPSGTQFNQIDTSCNVDRRSYEGPYDVVDGYPRNPRGRTGCKGRGSLGRWGPNHAADPIVTRWKRDENNEVVLGDDGKPMLQFVSVQRRDCGEWALPGGMVNPGDNRTATLAREFGEEALSSLEVSDEERARIDKILDEFFTNGDTIYRGYVDDPRNTDNAWMETKAMNFHDDTGEGVGKFDLKAGDDAAAVQWMDISKEVKLYASHEDFIKSTVDLRKAHW